PGGWRARGQGRGQRNARGAHAARGLDHRPLPASAQELSSPRQTPSRDQADGQAGSQEGGGQQSAKLEGVVSVEPLGSGDGGQRFWQEHSGPGVSAPSPKEQAVQ